MGAGLPRAHPRGGAEPGDQWDACGGGQAPGLASPVAAAIFSGTRDPSASSGPLSGTTPEQLLLPGG